LKCLELVFHFPSSFQAVSRTAPPEAMGCAEGPFPTP
jgi:hypothetical protein